jgi:hypothetical protein
MINEYEKDTDDVYKALMAVDSTKKLCTFIDELKTTYSDMSFAEYFNRYMADFEGSRQTLARSSQIGKDYIYPILKGTKKPERDKIIALCLTVGMTDQECTRCLERSNYGILYAKNQRDAVIIYAFRNRFSVMQLNEKLYDLGLKPLSLIKE